MLCKDLIIKVTYNIKFNVKNELGNPKGKTDSP